MDYQTLIYTLADNIAVIQLNRPEKMNALSTRMRRELTFAVTEAGKTARVVVITGTGSAFCSGQDLGGSMTPTNLDIERTLRDEYAPMARAILDCPVPTIAAVNGAAAGAGANLALLADVVIASDSAYFVQAFARIGLIPDAGGTYVLPRSMGMAKTMGAALFADKITAAQADAWGMIWEAVPDADFEAHWRARAAYLAAGPTATYAAIKATLRETWGQGFDDQFALEARAQGRVGKSRDFKEGVLAFTEKRSPRFEGR